MSANTPSNQDQEIDLSLLTKKIAGIFESFLGFIFNCILYVKKNIVILGSLFIVGAVLGYFLDYSNNNYKSNLIVTPNFGCTDYTYDKIDLLNARILQADTVFLKSIGILKPKKLNSLEIEPVIDIYNFVGSSSGTTANNAQNTQNFELVKLLAEDGDIKKVIKDELTSKNYSHHLVTINTNGLASEKDLINPIVNYLNQSDFYLKFQKTYVGNQISKIKQNDIIIGQIDNILNQFSNNSTVNQKSDKLVYYNENTQLNDIIKTKDVLIAENNYLKNQLVTLDKIVKERSRVINIKNKKGLGSKMKFVLPIFFILVFLGFKFYINFYKKQSQKLLNQ